MNLQHLLTEGHNSAKQFEATAHLVRKWAATGLLEGLKTDYEKHSISILLENQAKQLVSESNATGTASNSEQWSGVALPLVRRIFKEIAAKDFVSVQPMNLPSGLIFYMDFKYATARPGFSTTNSSNDPTNPAYQTNSLFGVTSDTGNPTGGLYGPGKFGYSFNNITASLASSGSYTPSSTQAKISAALTMASEADFDEFNFDSNFTTANSASIANGDFKKITIAMAALTSPDLEGVRAFGISGTGISAYFPQFTKNINDTTMSFIVSGSIAYNAAAGTVVAQYHAQPTSDARGDFEDKTGANLNIPELNVEMKSIPIVAETRKLKAVWSPEFAQDLNSYHSIDAEAELTSMLSEYISQEIDLEILDMLMQNAITEEYWSTQTGFEYNPNTAKFEMTQSQYASAYNQGSWFQTLGTKIQKVSNKIHQKTMRGGANFMVCSPDVATILESIPGYAADTNGDKEQFAMGVQKVGLLNNRFQTYKNPYMTDNIILLGFRGTQFLETGAVYAPYIPLIMTPLVYDPENFTPRKGVMTRYSKKIVRPEFYGKIYIHGLNRI